MVNSEYMNSRRDWTLEALQAALAELALEGWLLYDFRGSNPVAVQASGLASTGTRRWFLWIPVRGPTEILVHAIEVSNFRHFNPGLQAAMTTYVSWQDLHAALARMLSGIRTVAMEYSPGNAVPYVDRVDGGVLDMVRAEGRVEVVSSADLVQRFQAVLSAGQVDSHRRAAARMMAIRDEAFAHAAAQLEAGLQLDEWILLDFILARMAHYGVEADHSPLVAVNGNAANPHYAPSAEHHAGIGRGDMLLLDLWGRMSGLPDACFADITWTAYCGAQVPDRVARVFSIVREARDACLDFIRTGLRAGNVIRGHEADDVCRRIIAAQGYGDRFIHRTGHSLGPEIHFSGVNIDNVETRDDRTLRPGIMFTIEPGIYLPELDFDDSGRARGLGIRSEVNCLVHAGDLEVTTLPLQTEVIPLLP